jgi:hypothetical protein
LKYRAGANIKDPYSMILMGAAFIHIQWLREFHSATDPTAKFIRDLVDQGFNGEDIGMNALVASKNGYKHPILVVGNKRWFNEVQPGTGVSNGASHVRKRARFD